MKRMDDVAEALEHAIAGLVDAVAGVAPGWLVLGVGERVAHAQDDVEVAGRREVVPRADLRGDAERARASDHRRADVGGGHVVAGAGEPGGQHPDPARAVEHARGRLRQPRRERRDVALRRQERLGDEELVEVGQRGVLGQTRCQSTRVIVTR